MPNLFSPIANVFHSNKIDTVQRDAVQAELDEHAPYANIEHANAVYLHMDGNRPFNSKLSVLKEMKRNLKEQFKRVDWKSPAPGESEFLTFSRAPGIAARIFNPKFILAASQGTGGLNLERTKREMELHIKIERQCREAQCPVPVPTSQAGPSNEASVPVLSSSLHNQGSAGQLQSGAQDAAAPAGVANSQSAPAAAEHAAPPVSQPPSVTAGGNNQGATAAGIEAAPAQQPIGHAAAGRDLNNPVCRSGMDEGAPLATEAIHTSGVDDEIAAALEIDNAAAITADEATARLRQAQALEEAATLLVTEASAETRASVVELNHAVVLKREASDRLEALRGAADAKADSLAKQQALRDLEQAAAADALQLESRMNELANLEASVQQMRAAAATTIDAVAQSQVEAERASTVASELADRVEPTRVSFIAAQTLNRTVLQETVRRRANREQAQRRVNEAANATPNATWPANPNQRPNQSTSADGSNSADDRAAPRGTTLQGVGQAELHSDTENGSTNGSSRSGSSNQSWDQHQNPQNAHEGSTVSPSDAESHSPARTTPPFDGSMHGRHMDFPIEASNINESDSDCEDESRHPS